jgi:hypothetical protein
MFDMLIWTRVVFLGFFFKIKYIFFRVLFFNILLFDIFFNIFRLIKNIIRYYFIKVHFIFILLSSKIVEIISQTFVFLHKPL